MRHDTGLTREHFFLNKKNIQYVFGTLTFSKNYN